VNSLFVGTEFSLSRNASSYSTQSSYNIILCALNGCLVATDVADSQKPVWRSSSELVSRGSPSGVVIKSLAEIKREKVRRMQQRAATTDDMQIKTSEPAQPKQRDSKIKPRTQRGMARYHDFTDLDVNCFASVV